MKPVVWLDEAVSDLKDIGLYIAKHNKTAAKKVLKQMKRSADQLSEHPLSGRTERVAGTRELVIPNLPYILPYQITGNEVRILAVMHTSRKWLTEFSNMDNE